MVTLPEYLEPLRPFFQGDPNNKGEIDMRCPVHPGGDRRRSAQANPAKGVWYCHACGNTGSLKDLADRMRLESRVDAGGKSVAFFVDEDGSSANGSKVGKASNGGAAPPGRAAIAGWASSLLSDHDALQNIQERKGASLETIRTYRIGWDRQLRAYTIPIYDSRGEIANVRFYQLDPSDDRRKIWSVKGIGQVRLFPIDQVQPGDWDEIIVCEGEWDAMLTVQNGLRAVTRTGGATTWEDGWNRVFADKVVYVCHDMDAAGRTGNTKVATALSGTAKEVYELNLPYPVTEKHGKDLADFWLEGNTVEDLRTLMAEASGYDPSEETPPAEEVQDVSIKDTLDAGYSGTRMRMRITVSGRRVDSYNIPEDVRYTCTQDMGVKCLSCPMMQTAGKDEVHIVPSDKRILEMIDSSKDQVEATLRDIIGAPKCPKLNIERTDRSVEQLYVRTPVGEQHSENLTRKIINVGGHFTDPNVLAEVVGTNYPDPRSQYNTFQAWDLNKVDSSIDRYDVTAKGIKLMQRFAPRGKQSPYSKLHEIVVDLSANVTRIIQRELMHAVMDLVWHSVLQFEFERQVLQRGWLEGLVVGDTRTGKSEAAHRLNDHYGLGEMISCEAATFAGVVGGLQQLSGNQWEVTWGTVPLNDRRLVVLDEVSGLSLEEISKMSDIRSSGVADLRKIRQERTNARTRLLWLGNPRSGSMDRYMYGVEAIPPLIGNREDVARFDLATAVRSSEVSSSMINSQERKAVAHRYTAEACHELLLWAWSRRPEQVVWAAGAERAVLDAAQALGENYVDEPVPLIQGANVRVKVARLAVALAARTFSTDATYENVVINPQHVVDAVKFLRKVYEADTFGYARLSDIEKKKVSLAARNYDECRSWITSYPGLGDALSKTHGKFRAVDLEEMLNVDRDTARTIVSRLNDLGMIERQKGENVMSKVLMSVVREAQG